MALKQNMYNGMTLKALLENPDLQIAPALLTGGQKAKDKKESNGLGSGDVDFTSAFLGPQLWNKPYDGSADFDLEYMDLDEFLCENGIPLVEDPSLDSLVTSRSPSPTIPTQPPVVAQKSPGLRDNPSVSPQPYSSVSMPSVEPHTLPIPTVHFLNPDQFLLKPKVEKREETSQKSEVIIPSSGAQSPSSTPPVSPLPVQVDFCLTEQDIALSSVPGQDVFDPTAHVFNPDELKPQPMMKKSKKVFVPADMKDDKYWARRSKNNFAAKRSRDARRVKENQIAMRAAYLEKLNTTLKEEMEKVLRENARLKHRLSKYESGNSST